MSFDRIHELMEEAAEMEHGAAQLALQKEALREADALNEIELSYHIRMEIIESATFSGAKDEALVAFSWCVAQHDAHPGDFDDANLIWRYKWILENLPGFPQVSRRQIADMQDDMQKRTQALGCSLRPVHYMRWSNLMRMGDFEQAGVFIEKWRDAPRDFLADCAACERDKYMEFLIFTGQNQEAIDYAAPILAGRMTCAEIPHLTYAELIRPYLLLGQLEQAAEMHRKGYAMISDNSEFLSAAAGHLVYVTRVRNLESGAAIFQRHLPWAVATASRDRQFDFYAAAAAFCTAIVNSGQQRMSLRTPASFALHRADGDQNVAELASWFEQQTASLAAQFNARNGNQFYSELQQSVAELAGVA